MKAKENKVVLFVITAIVVMSTLFIPASATADSPKGCVSAVANNSDVMPYADSIVVRKRVYNGKTQFRRWNATRNCWVDPYWIDA